VYTLLEHPLGAAERDDLYDVFRRVGEGLGIPELPATYADWRTDRDRHMHRDLAYGDLTAALYARYRTHLGPWRYQLLRRIQSLVAPPFVSDQLRLPRPGWIRPAVLAYRAARAFRLAPAARLALVPKQYLRRVADMDRTTVDSDARICETEVPDDRIRRKSASNDRERSRPPDPVIRDLPVI
jgi:hypothetical protein